VYLLEIRKIPLKKMDHLELPTLNFGGVQKSSSGFTHFGGSSLIEIFGMFEGFPQKRVHCLVW